MIRIFYPEIPAIKDVPNSDEMDKMLEALLDEHCKMTESALVASTGMKRAEVGTAPQRLLRRGMVRLDSFEHSKRVGRAGVRRWGTSYKTALWEAVRDGEEG